MWSALRGTAVFSQNSKSALTTYFDNVTELCYAHIPCTYVYEDMQKLFGHCGFLKLSAPVYCIDCELEKWNDRSEASLLRNFMEKWCESSYKSQFLHWFQGVLSGEARVQVYSSVLAHAILNGQQVLHKK